MVGLASVLLFFLFFFFFFNDTATTEIYTLSLHDALPIYHYPTTAGGPAFDSEFVIRPSMLEGRVFYWCHPDQGIGNQTKNPPLKNVKTSKRLKGGATRPK